MIDSALIVCSDYSTYKIGVYPCIHLLLQIDPNYANAWTNKGAVLGNLGKNEQAIECYEAEFQSQRLSIQLP